jgi:hypothetical protein
MDIIHTTLARYRTSGSFEPPELCVEPVHVRIRELQLVRERRYGLGEHDELARCALREEPC